MTPKKSEEKAKKSTTKTTTRKPRKSLGEKHTAAVEKKSEPKAVSELVKAQKGGEETAKPSAPKAIPYFYALGRRKSAMAKVRGFEDGNGISVNTLDYKRYFPSLELQKIVTAPLNALGLEKSLRWQIFVSGGGIHAQAEAVKLGIARALVKRNEQDKPTLKKLGFLTRDPRKKERKKPGRKKARRGPQWSKR